MNARKLIISTACANKKRSCDNCLWKKECNDGGCRFKVKFKDGGGGALELDCWRPAGCLIVEDNFMDHDDEVGFCSTCGHNCIPCYEVVKYRGSKCWHPKGTLVTLDEQHEK